MATALGEITSFKRLFMTFEDSIGKKVNLTLDNPKIVEAGGYLDIAAQDAAIEAAMNTIVTKNVLHNKGNDLVALVNARIVDSTSQDVMDVG